MPLYQIDHYLHVVGAMGLFLTLGLEWTSVARLRRAEGAEEARAWLSLLAIGRLIGPATLAAILLPGVYMAAAVWGWVGWIAVALAATVLMAALAAHNEIRLAGIGRDIGDGDGALPAPMAERLHNPLLVASLHSRVGIVLGIVFLMTAKPDPTFSLLMIGAAFVLGLASALPAWGRPAPQDNLAQGH